MEWVIFIPAAALAIAGGIGVITSRQPVHSAIALLIVLAALAVTYLLLAATLGAAGPLEPVPDGFGTAQQVGASLFATYLLPFELASVILLVGIVAAAVLGRRSVPGAGGLRGEDR